MDWSSSFPIICEPSSFPSPLKSVPDLGGSSAWGDDDDKLPFPKNATVTTLITTPRLIEGLTGDNHRNLYTAALEARLPARFGKSTSTIPV